MEDHDRIDVLEKGGTITESSIEDINSVGGSENNLTNSYINLLNRQINKNNAIRDRIPSPSNMVRRWSQNLSKIGKARKTMKQKTIYSLPSRNVFALKGNFQNSPEDTEIDRIVNEMEQFDYLMENTALGKQIRMDTIKALPHSLTSKRKLKEKLSISIIQHSSRMDRGRSFDRLKASLLFSTKRVWNTVKVKINSIEIWYSSLKIIEGNFGSSVSSYFKFLRWLFMLNVILLFFTFSFITLPQIIFNNSGNKIKDTINLNEQNSNFSFLDILTGEGSLASSILFYGSYTNMSLSMNNSTSIHYSLPHAYFMTMLFLYLITFIVVSSSMARSYRKSFIETSGGIRSMYAHKIFCSWDFSIASSKAAQIKHSTIYNELKEVLNEFLTEKNEYSRLWKLWLLCSQLIAHLLILGMISGLGVAMWLLLQQFAEEDKFSPWQTLYLSIAVNFTMVLLQGFFSWIATMEDYESPRRSLHITLMRNFMLEAVIIGIVIQFITFSEYCVLVFFWLTKDYKGCWETSIGQEIYRLVMVDFIISAILSPAVQIFQAFVIREYFPSIDKPDFDISRKSLGLIFNQTLLWVGLVFSPLLAAVIAVKMILMFYIKKFTLIYVCRTPKQIWRSAQTITLYLVFLFISLLGVVVGLGYIMTQVRVSEKCGPFRGYDFMFQIFVNGVLQLKQNHWIWRAIMTLTRPAVLGGILLTMAVVVYYLRAKSKAREAMVKLLKDMLYLEAKDKEFLLMNIAKVTNERDWMFNSQDSEDFRLNQNAFVDNFAECSSTWRFERVNRTNVDGDNVLRSRHI